MTADMSDAIALILAERAPRRFGAGRYRDGGRRYADSLSALHSRIMAGEIHFPLASGLPLGFIEGPPYSMALPSKEVAEGLVTAWLAGDSPTLASRGPADPGLAPTLAREDCPVCDRIKSVGTFIPCWLCVARASRA